MSKAEEKVLELVAPRGYAHDGDQYDLFLALRAKDPWDGKSPRSLTKTWKRFSLGAHTRGGAARPR